MTIAFGAAETADERAPLEQGLGSPAFPLADHAPASLPMPGRRGLT